jgi:hypothetical protein
MFQRHVQEQQALIDEAFTVGKKAMSRIAARKAAYEARMGKPKKTAAKVKKA